MKLRLNFNSEQEFQNFCNQLFSAEFSSYQAIEGSGGDKGIDGLHKNTVFQIFFPDIKNRIKSKYIDKINEDLEKIKKTIKENQLKIERWIITTPEDLSADVTIYLQKISEEIGLECIGWGASKLTELLGKYPHIKKSFPSVFMQDIEGELKELSEKIGVLFNPKITDSGIEIIGDEDFTEQNTTIDREYRNKSQGAQNRFGASSASFAADQILREEAGKKKRDLRRKKETSDKMYKLLKRDIETQFEEIIQKKREEFAQRGLSGSGLENKVIGFAELKKNGELEKLKLRYGKNEN